MLEAARSAVYGTNLDHDSYKHESLFDGAELEAHDHLGIQHAQEHPSANQLLGLGTSDEAYLDRADSILEETLDKDIEAKQEAKAAEDEEAKQMEEAEEDMMDEALI